MLRFRSIWLMFFVVLTTAAAAVHPARAQARENTMTNAEIEKLRDAAYDPLDRIAVFIKILDARGKAIDDLLAKRQRPSTPDDLHDLLDQFSGIADELDDNLDTYGPKHRDLRKALPKLVEATERWSTTLRSLPDDAQYKVVRKLALDAVQDVHDAAAQLQTDQITYFKEHPQAAKAEAQRNDPRKAQEPIDIPR